MCLSQKNINFVFSEKYVHSCLWHKYVEICPFFFFRQMKKWILTWLVFGSHAAVLLQVFKLLFTFIYFYFCLVSFRCKCHTRHHTAVGRVFIQQYDAYIYCVKNSLCHSDDHPLLCAADWKCTIIMLMSTLIQQQKITPQKRPHQKPCRSGFKRNVF